MEAAERLNTLEKQSPCVLCSNEDGVVTNGQTVSLHTIPKNEDKRQAWIERILEWKPEAVITDDLEVCSLHFADNVCDLDSIPTKFNTEEEKIGTSGDVLEKIADSLKVHFITKYLNN